MIYHFIPNHLIPLNWTCTSRKPIDNLEDLLSKSNGKLRICGDAKKLFNTLSSYASFPGSSKLFGFESEDMFKKHPHIYDNLRNNKKFIYKSDVFNLLRSRFFRYPQLENFKLSQEIILFFLQHFEGKLSNYSEMMEYSVEHLDAVSSHVKNVFLMGIDPDEEGFTDARGFIQSLFEKLGETETDGVNEDHLIEIVKKYIFPFEENAWEFNCIIHRLSFLITIIHDFYYNQIAQPNDPENEIKPVVRLFNEGKHHFFLVYELIGVTKEKGYDIASFEEYIGDSHRLREMHFAELAGLIDKDVLKNIEFIPLPHCKSNLPVPLIPTIDGNYCIKFENFLCQLCTDMIVFKNTFQIIKPDQLSLIEKFLKFINKKCYGVAFINMEQVGILNRNWNAFFEVHFKKRSMECTIKEVRRVTRKREFTLENVKKELMYLNLHLNFPDIIGIAEDLYDNKINKNRVHEPDSLFEAVVKCQLTCLQIMWSKICRLENKNELEENDDACSGSKESTEQQEDGPSGNVETASEAVNDVANSKESVVGETMENEEFTQNPSTSKRISVSTACEEEAALEETTKKVSDVVVSQKRKNQKIKKQKSLENSEVEVVRNTESNTCPKCFNSSQFRRKTEEKLKISKIENKQLKKEIHKQNEMIEMLKLQLEEKEKLIQKMIEEKEEISKKEAPAVPKIDFSDDSKDALFTILSIRNTIQKENPLKKAEEITKKLSTSSKKQEIQKTARIEFREFEKKCKYYIKTVEQQVNHVLSQSNIPSNWTPSLPEFPQFSKEFHVAFWKTLSLEVPKICESLSKEIELEDCSICLNEINLYHDIINCDCCRKNFHVKCAKDWFKIQRNCPQCRRGMLDPIEFPKL